MPKKAAELGSLQVSRLKEPGLHAVGGVAGLCLQIAKPPSNARSWVLRTVIGGKRREVGLGGYPDVTLAGARDAARAARVQIVAGIDPIEAKKEARSILQASIASAWTFDECAEAYIETKAPEWSNAKHRAQWDSTIAAYASPVLGRMLARDIGLPHVLAVLQPIWLEKNETAMRLRGRIEKILDWATTSGYRTGLNPARWKGHLETALAAPNRSARIVHHSALPAAAMGEFMRDLRKAEGVGARALEFAILNAARSGEVRGATWGEIDLQNSVWTVPPSRMKAGKEHRVPLSGAALRVLKAQPQGKGAQLVFAAPKGGQLSDMTLSAVLRRMEVPAVPHGFRSTFRDWCAESTNYPREVAEMALAHTISDKVEAAYRRGDLFAKRIKLMQEWANFCGRVQTDATVTPIASRKRKAG